MWVCPNIRVVVSSINANQTDGTLGRITEADVCKSLKMIVLQMEFCMWSESVPLTCRYSAAPWQCHVLGVPPRHRLHRSVQPEGLSDAHGGEGEAGQILP